MAKTILQHSPAPWRWQGDWPDVQGKAGGVDEHEDGYPKFADLRLLDASGQNILPIRIDHYDPLWDDDGTMAEPTPADRALIEASPDMLAELKRLNNVILAHAQGVNKLSDVAWLEQLEHLREVIDKATTE